MQTKKLLALFDDPYPRGLTMRFVLFLTALTLALAAPALALPSLASLTFPTPVSGGTIVTATVTLSEITATDVVVGLTSNDPAAVRIHRAVVIPAGSVCASFTIKAYPTPTPKEVTIQAALGQSVRTTALIITNTPKRIVLWGDSRTFGALDPGDFLANPDPIKSSGSGYTSDPQVTIVYNGSGSGAAASARYNAANGQIAIGITQKGSGFIAGHMPTLTITGGGGTDGDYSFGNGPGGGFTVPVETYLHAGGFLDAACLNAGMNGAEMTAEKPNGYRVLAAETSAQDPANSVIVIDEGINDALQGSTAQQYHDALMGIVSRFVADGFFVIIDKPFGIAPTFSDHPAMVNALVQSYGAAIESVAADYPGHAFIGWDGYTAMQDHLDLLGDGLHPSPAGDAFIGPLKGAAYRPILTTLFGTPMAAARVSGRRSAARSSDSRGSRLRHHAG